jgi:hypothetical protein
MKPNMGNLDRIIRIVVGVVLIAYALRLGFPETGWNWVGWIGVVPILTALVRVCPAYSIMGIRTDK